MLIELTVLSVSSRIALKDWLSSSDGKRFLRLLFLFYVSYDSHETSRRGSLRKYTICCTDLTILILPKEILLFRNTGDLPYFDSNPLRFANSFPQNII